MRICITISLIFLAFGCKPAASVSNKNKSALMQKPGKITVNGLTFNYVEAGNGPVVILIHGSVSDYREWSKLIAPLSRHYRVIAYSRRYHSPNLPPASDADARVVYKLVQLSEGKSWLLILYLGEH